MQVEDIFRYFIINKPYDMVSQFQSPHKVKLLGDLDFDFPEGTHAIGRLDNNSEGLLILTTNKKVTKLLFSTAESHPRTYLVQVNNMLSIDNLANLKSGVVIRVKGATLYRTPPCEVTVVEDPEILYPPAFTGKYHGPHTWILITLREGKFRQVRKMMAAVRHRCKRLIRISIEDLMLGDLKPGCVKEMNEKDFFAKLKIKY